MKEPWQEIESDQPGRTRYAWWKYRVTNEKMFGDESWHVLFIGCRIHKTTAAEAAIAYAEQHATDELRDRIDQKLAAINDLVGLLAALHGEVSTVTPRNPSN